MPELVHLAIPAFIALMVLEAVVSVVHARREAREEGGGAPKGYAPRDTAASLAMGVGNVVINLATKGGRLAIFTALYQYRVFDLGSALGSGALLFAVALVVEDFVYYWNHRFGHEVRFFWAAHVTHHSSQHYNLSTALRQTWTGWFTHLFFYWPLPLLGFDPMLLLSVGSVNLLYQFWIHTEYLDRMPRWFEAVFNTPSHHRVHHGTNVEYLDRNHAGIFIVWDRLFGTFEPEVAPPSYGLTKNLERHDPFTIAFHEWIAMARDVARAGTWRERIGYLLGPPGWSPDGSTRTARQMRAALERPEPGDASELGAGASAAA
ncbi:MAG: sterol desaturase family protein [Myxococcales bacterium]|nr:sterol desaturase family protein [Myxococcales bacterium]